MSPLHFLQWLPTIVRHRDNTVRHQNATQSPKTFSNPSLCRAKHHRASPFNHRPIPTVHHRSTIVHLHLAYVYHHQRILVSVEEIQPSPSSSSTPPSSATAVHHAPPNPLQPPPSSFIPPPPSSPFSNPYFQLMFSNPVPWFQCSSWWLAMGLYDGEDGDGEGR
ncbi:hypothetical protein RIF29_12836 [Crotalaria pallida]|uniref:Uncharacterized protein n=1 Tax=Crotalaria pallida TaxID=3830 RepID=A0AAN9P2G4_CROPI